MNQPPLTHPKDGDLPLRESKRTVFCLPFAGGGVLSYQQFVRHAPDGTAFVTLSAPGKDQRMQEPLLTDLKALAKQYAEQIIRSGETDYLLYGHSMGALMVHLVIHELRNGNAPLPKHAVASSYPAPMHHHDRGRRNMDDSAFIRHMKKLGGLPPRLLAEPRLMRVFLPILRADITAIDDFRYEENEKHDVPMTILFGSKEVQLQSVILDWQKESTQKVTVQRLEGGHFFIFEQLEKMMNIFGSLMNTHVLSLV